MLRIGWGVDLSLLAQEVPGVDQGIGQGPGEELLLLLAGAQGLVPMLIPIVGFPAGILLGAGRWIAQPLTRVEDPTAEDAEGDDDVETDAETTARGDADVRTDA